MPRTLLTAAFSALLLTPGVAAAQCEARLARAAEAVGHLPDAVDAEVHDRLNELYHEAEGLVGADEAGCLAAVERMEAMIRANGVRISGAGAPTIAAPAPTTATRASVAPTPGVTPPAAFASALPARLAALSAERRAEVSALSDYVEAVRSLGGPLAQQAAPSAPAEAARTAEAASDAIESAEAVQAVLINQEGDRLHAELEDAVRRLDAADAALDQATSNALKVLPEEDAVVDAAMAKHRQARERYERARANLDGVRRRLDQWLEEQWDEDYLPGYAAAFRALEAKHQQESRDLDARCDAAMRAGQIGVAQAYASGDRNSNALGDSIAQCRAISEPIRRRQQQEADALEARYARTPARR